ncbi:MAG: TIGR02281 family clan AA aspartic protease, partial [Pseudomonadota bacterium]
QVAQQGAIWFLIFIGFIVVYGLWDDISQTLTPRQTVVTEGDQTVIEVPQGPSGHYQLILQVNGVGVPFVVDTGATDLVLSREDAARVGIDVDSLRFFGQARTANGIVGTASVRLEEVALGEAVDRDVQAVVNEGDLFSSLLGMSYLQRFGRIEITGDRLRLIR